MLLAQLAFAATVFQQDTGDESAAIAFNIVGLILNLIVLAGYWKIFEKAGRPGIIAIIPIYREVVLFQMTGQSGWMVLLLMIPLVNIFIVFKLFIDLARAFGKDELYGIGLVLLSFIFIPMLGFGDATYQDPNAPLTTWRGDPVNAPTRALRQQSPQVTIRDSYGLGGSLIVDRKPDLERIFTDPDPIWPQEGTTDAGGRSLEDRRMALAIGYLQHPDPEVRLETIKYVREIESVRVSKVLYDMLMFEPEREVREAAAQMVWAREGESNCKAAAAALSHEMNHSGESRRRYAARNALHDLIDTAPNAEAAQAVRSALDAG